MTQPLLFSVVSYYTCRSHHLHREGSLREWSHPGLPFWNGQRELVAEWWDYLQYHLKVCNQHITIMYHGTVGSPVYDVL